MNQITDFRGLTGTNWLPFVAVEVLEIKKSKFWSEGQGQEKMNQIADFRGLTGTNWLPFVAVEVLECREMPGNELANGSLTYWQQ